MHWENESKGRPLCEHSHLPSEMVMAIFRAYNVQDEFGSVAVFAAQLDDYLGGSPVQYRQVQQLEDAEFRKVCCWLFYLCRWPSYQPSH